MLTDWDDFLAIEKEYKLSQLEIEGCNYWQYGRSRLMEYLTTVAINGDKPYAKSEKALKKQHLQNAKILVAFLIRSRFSARRIKKSPCDILFASAVNRIEYKGEAYNQFVDPIMDLYDNSVLLEPSYNFRRHSKNIHSKNVIFIDYYEANAIIAYYLHKFTRDYKEKLNIVKNQLSEPMRKICDLFRLDSVPEVMYANMVDCIARRKNYKKFCIKALKCFSPKLIVETCHYSFENLVMNEAAYEMGIQVVELQHGGAGKTHCAYNYPNNVFIKQFPTHFFAFSKFWMEKFNLPIADENILSVGAPYKEMRATEILNDKKVQSNDKKIILFLMEGIDSSRQFAETAIRLNELIDNNKYQIILKLHPQDYAAWQDKYSDAANAGLRIVHSNNPDLYELFSEAECQVGANNSTTIYEGLNFGLRTFIDSNLAGPEFASLCEEGYAQGFANAHELYDKIFNPNESGAHGEFWEKDALVKTKNALDSILCTYGISPC